MSIGRVSGFAGLFFVLVSPLAAQPPGAASGWNRYSTPHFEILSNVEPAARAETLARDLEQLRAALAALGNEAVVTSPLPHEIFFFADDATYDHYRLAAGAAGSLVATEHAVYMLVRDQRYGDPEDILYRQYLHDVLDRNMPELPPWLRYGIVELYSSFTATTEGLDIGRPIPGHLQVLAGTGFLYPRLDGLLDAEDRLAGAADFFRIESWALTHYLLLGVDDGREKMRRLIERLRAGDSNRQALASAYGLTIEDLETRLDDYVQQETFFNFRLTGTQLPSFAIDRTRLDEAEAYAALGDLLTYTDPDRRDEAESHFRKALEARTDIALAWEGLGYLCLEERRGADCSEPLEHAVRIDPDSARARFLLGRTYLERYSHPGAPAERMASLARAVEAFESSVDLEPGFAEGWAQLGAALLIDPRTAERGVGALERAHRLLPQRHDVALNLLLAYANAGDAEGADRVLAELERRGAPDATRERAAEVRLGMRYVEANRLMREDRLEDALGLLARIESETSDQELRDKATHQIEVVGSALQHNRFAASYREAVELMRRGERERAATELEALLREARPGPQQDAVEVLLDRLLEEGSLD